MAGSKAAATPAPAAASEAALTAAPAAAPGLVKLIPTLVYEVLQVVWRLLMVCPGFLLCKKPDELGAAFETLAKANLFKRLKRA